MRKRPKRDAIVLMLLWPLWQLSLSYAWLERRVRESRRL